MSIMIGRVSHKTWPDPGLFRVFLDQLILLVMTDKKIKDKASKAEPAAEPKTKSADASPKADPAALKKKKKAKG
jgi:hypothetical protein